MTSFLGVDSHGEKPNIADSVHTTFVKYGQTLDSMNEKRERLVKASRDVTIHSKKVIFAVHRSKRVGQSKSFSRIGLDRRKKFLKNPKLFRKNLDRQTRAPEVFVDCLRATGANRENLLKQAENDLAVVRINQVSRIARELKGNEYWQYRRAFSPGMQEFVEAATVVEYSKTGQLLTLERLNESLKNMRDAGDAPFKVSINDYILGVADFTGELMRLAVSGIAAGQQQIALSVCNTVRAVFESLSALPPLEENLRDTKAKMDIMLQSLIKVETACYTVHVRGSEYPQDMLMDAFELSQGKE